MSRPLLIFGARVFSEEVADLASEIPGLTVAGFVENLEREHPRELRGLPVYWIDDVAGMAATHDAICGLGTTQRRAYMDQVEAMGFRCPPLVHPTARVPVSCDLDQGVIVSAGCLIAGHVRIGRHTILNRGVMIGHHTEIGAFTTIGPGANVAGLCSIGDQVWMGMSVVVADRLKIGAGSFVTAASVVTKNLPERVQASGYPARVIHSGIEPR